MEIHKRKQESTKLRKHRFDQESDQEKKERKHALDQVDQEKKRKNDNCQEKKEDNTPSTRKELSFFLYRFLGRFLFFLLSFFSFINFHL